MYLYRSFIMLCLGQKEKMIIWLFVKRKKFPSNLEYFLSFFLNCDSGFIEAKKFVFHSNSVHYQIQFHK